MSVLDLPALNALADFQDKFNDFMYGVMNLIYSGDHHLWITTNHTIFAVNVKNMLWSGFKAGLGFQTRHRISNEALIWQNKNSTDTNAVPVEYPTGL